MFRPQLFSAIYGDGSGESTGAALSIADDGGGGRSCTAFSIDYGDTREHAESDGNAFLCSFVFGCGSCCTRRPGNCSLAECGRSGTCTAYTDKTDSPVTEPEGAGNQVSNW